MLSIGVVSLAVVGGGLYFSQVMNLAACSLCIVQRMLYISIGLLCLIAALPPVGKSGTNTFVRTMAALAAVTSVCGVGVASYQSWLQRFDIISECGINPSWWEKLVYWAGDQLPWLFSANGLCEDSAWFFLGLSIAEWSLVIFVIFFLISLSVIIRPKRKLMFCD